MISSLPEPMITPHDGPRVTGCGGKAAGLLAVHHLAAVPAFVVVPETWFAQAARNELAELAAHWDEWGAPERSSEAAARLAAIRLTRDMRTALADAIATWIPDVTSFAVRSSAAGEDGDRRSFAGLYDTFLSVDADGLEPAITACWRSWFSSRALTHRDRADWQPPRMAVVLQRMVAAQQAGVAAVYDGTIEVEAVPGTGDRLVSGTADPQRHVFAAPPSRPESVADHAAGISATLHRQLAQGDLEVEWAADRDQVWIVQARPLTTALPAAPALHCAERSHRPTLCAVDLYAPTDPGSAVPLGPLEEIVGHYRTKRCPLYRVGADHGCGPGAAVVVHFNPAGLDGSAWTDLARRLGSSVVVDVSPAERQTIIPTADLRVYLASLAGGDRDAMRTVVVREFITGQFGALTTLSGDVVRMEFSTDGLLALNRGYAHADSILIPVDGDQDVPNGWSPTAVGTIAAVTRQFVGQHGPAVVEWVLPIGGVPVPVDYSRTDTDQPHLLARRAARIISVGSCRGPAVVIDSSSAPALTADSVAPVVSVSGTLPPPTQTSVAELADQIRRLESKPVVFVAHPYVVLATLIPHVAGFVFTQPAGRLCHLGILLREYGIPAACLPETSVPAPGELVTLSADGRLTLRAGK